VVWFLAGCLLRQRDDAANPLLREEWRAFEDASRGNLMAALQQHLPPSLMIPERRLETLVEQALQAQVCRLSRTLTLSTLGLGLVSDVLHAAS